MNKLYIYNIETNEHVATITGSSNDDCEIVATERYGCNDYSWTYSPAFGFGGGLEYNDNAEEIAAN
jgi:hypothetical protein